MLKGILRIRFTPIAPKGNGYYNAAEITYLQIKFDDDLYFVGFLRGSKERDQYFFDEEYEVEVVFPSINREVYEMLENKINSNFAFPICLGKLVIGTTYFNSCEYLDMLGSNRNTFRN